MSDSYWTHQTHIPYERRVKLQEDHDRRMEYEDWKADRFG